MVRSLLSLFRALTWNHSLEARVVPLELQENPWYQQHYFDRLDVKTIGHCQAHLEEAVSRSYDVRLLHERGFFGPPTRNTARAHYSASDIKPTVRIFSRYALHPHTTEGHHTDVETHLELYFHVTSGVQLTALLREFAKLYAFETTEEGLCLTLRRKGLCTQHGASVYTSRGLPPPRTAVFQKPIGQFPQYVISL